MLTSLLVTVVVFLLLGRNFFADPDLWWHLRDARELIQTHSYPHSETYSFTAVGTTWINSEWLSEIPFYLAWRWRGPFGLFVLTVFLIEAVVLGVVALSWQRTQNMKPALIAGCVFLPMLSVSMAPRTIMFGWLCLVLEIFLLREFRDGRDRLWLLPILFILWINLHGTWPIGIVYLILVIASGGIPRSWLSAFVSITLEPWSAAQRAKLIRVFAITILALFVNPYGAYLVAFPFHMLFGHRLMIASVAEWQPLDFHTLRGKLTFVLIAVLLIVSIVRKRSWRLDDLAFTLIAVLGAFTYTRLLVLAGIVLSPALAVELNYFRPYRPSTDKSLLNFVVIALMVSLLITHLPKSFDLHQQIAESCPVGALKYLQSTHPQGKVFNELNWGGFIEWNNPHEPVFIDSRSEIYDASGVLADYIDTKTIKRPFEVLDRYHIQVVLFPRNERLPYLLTRTSGWVMTYEDKNAIVCERQTRP